MTDELGSPIHDQLWTLVQALNNLWVNGDPDKLAPFFRDDVVVLHFDYKTRLRGRQVVLDSYRDFCSESTVHLFKQFRPVIDVFDSTGVVTYAFEIEYNMGGKTYHETGRDMFVFLREGDQWLAVWRTMLPDPPASDAPAAIEE